MTSCSVWKTSSTFSSGSRFWTYFCTTTCKNPSPSFFRSLSQRSYFSSFRIWSSQILPTSVIVACNFSSSIGFRRYANAPRSHAFCAYSKSLYALNTTNWHSGFSFLISSITISPEICFILMSVSTTCGFFSRIIFNACSPLCAKPTTSYPIPFQSYVFTRPSSRIGSSSTITSFNNPIVHLIPFINTILTYYSLIL